MTRRWLMASLLALALATPAREASAEASADEAPGLDHQASR